MKSLTPTKVEQPESSRDAGHVHNEIATLREKIETMNAKQEEFFRSMSPMPRMISQYQQSQPQPQYSFGQQPAAQSLALPVSARDHRQVGKVQQQHQRPLSARASSQNATPQPSKGSLLSPSLGATRLRG